MKNMCMRMATLEENKATTDAMEELYRESYLNAYKVIVVGGRDFSDYEYMSEKLNELFWCSDIFRVYPIKIIIGMEEGADMLVIRYADEYNMTKILFPANRKEYLHQADVLRDEDMLAFATHLIVFVNHEPYGAELLIIEKARKKGIPIWIFGCQKANNQNVDHDLA